jgi:hypothetical protein
MRVKEVGDPHETPGLYHTAQILPGDIKFGQKMLGQEPRSMRSKHSFKSMADPFITLLTCSFQSTAHLRVSGSDTRRGE